MVFAKKNPSQDFFDHFDELRNRLLKCLLVFTIVGIVFYNYTDIVLRFLVKPVGKLVFTAPADAFLARMHITIFGSIVISLPFILYEIWSFVAAGLEENERRFVTFFGPLSFFLFLIGVFFAYFVVVPISLTFFMSFASDVMEPMINVRSYLSYMLSLMLSFGLVFELPFVLYFLTKIGIATPEFLVQKRRHAIVIIMIISAIMTPPDVISLLMMTVPMVLLYEIGIWFSKMSFQKDFILNADQGK